MGLIDSLKLRANELLGVRDSLGVTLYPVYLVTKQWSGAEPGDGTLSESVEQVLPTPRIVEFKQDMRIKEGGQIRSGDILLKLMSKESFPEVSLVDGSTDSLSIQKVYRINNRDYTVISVSEKYLYFNVLLRPVQ